jgi:hypothetical protein
MKPKGLFLFFISLFPIATLAASFSIPVDECIGNLRLKFPSQVEVAANTGEMLIDEHKIRTIQPKFEFVDGERAGWTSIGYGGNIFVSHALSIEQKNKLMLLQKKMFHTAQSADRKKTEKVSGFEKIEMGQRIGFAAQVGTTFTASIFLNDHMIWRQSTVTNDAVAGTKGEFDYFIKNVEFRPIGVVPSTKGLCLPYFFISGEGRDENARGRISSTYRLKNHPDVTIWIEDSDAGIYPDKHIEQANMPINQINDFWSQYEILPGISKVESEWHLPAGRKVKMNGGNGIASFVKIKRKSGAVDYGYMAAVRGDIKDGQRSSDIKFYVIRNSENSSRKNLEPIDKNEFLKISEEIVSTIKGNLGH